LNPFSLRTSLVALGLLLAPILVSAQSGYQTSEEYMTPKKRELYFYGMRSYPLGKIPQNARNAALEQAANRNSAYGKRSRILAAGRWTQHGPLNVGGRVNSIAVHPTDGRTLWIGAADGGVWKSSNRGDSWTSMMDGENSIAMGAIAVAPSNPNILYAGTGEHTSNIDAYLGTGVLRSIDGGETWKLAGLSTVGAFSRILVHPTNPDIVIAGATKNGGGLYRSADGGKTWSKESTIKSVTDLTMNPQNPNEIWIGTSSQGIFHSTDGGVTATASNTGLGVSGFTLRRVSVQVSQSNPSILFALIDELKSNVQYSRIYKSSNSGTSWTNVFNGSGANHFMNDQGWYNNVIAVNPNDPNIVLAGGVTIVRTTNGGTNWSSVGGVHADQHAMAFDPSNPSVFYAGCDGGMYRSTSTGAGFSVINTGLAITQFYAMAIDQQDGNRSYGGTQDNGTLSNTSDTYGDIAGGDGGYVAVDHSNPNILYGETQNGFLWKKDLSSNSLTSIMDGIDQTTEADPPWMAPIAIDPVDPNVLYSGRQRVYKTFDGGTFWAPANENLIGKVSAIAVSRADHDVVWAGTETGAVHVSTDGGGSWTDRSYAPGLVNRWITDFAPSNTEKGTCYVSVSGFLAAHILKTTNFGETWTDVSYGLPDIPVNALVIDPENAQTIFAGTDIGVFVTDDGGATWITFNDGMPRVGVVDMEISRTGRKLIAATHGRSMWEIELAGRAAAPGILSPTGGEVWTGNTLQLISWHGFTAPVRIEYSLDDGETWVEIASNVGGTSMRWNVKNTPTIFGRIRITGSKPGEQVTSRSFTIEELRLGSVIGGTSKPVVPYAIAYDGEFVWVTDFSSTRMLKLDRNTLATVAVIEANLEGADSLITDLAYVPERGTFFVNRLASTSGTGGFLYEMTKAGEQVGRWSSPAIYPIGLAWLGGAESETQYLLVTDRNGTDQMIYLMDINDPTSPTISFPRRDKVELGPRGASAAGTDGKYFWQVITDFTGGSLQNATAQKINVESQDVECVVQLATSFTTSGVMNARGIEFDPEDLNLWVTDYSGNIWKMVTCEGLENQPSTGVPAPKAPVGITLEQNVPNPFAGETTIRFSLLEPTDLKLVVHDMKGNLVATLHEGRLASGSHAIGFNPAGLSSGVYRYSLILSSGAVVSRTMVLVK
jgi:photosystem II stability/assembly factor-like uncharacterized protein